MYNIFHKFAISAAVIIFTVCGVVASERNSEYSISAVNSSQLSTEDINLRRQNRGLVEMGTVVVPKGQWVTGTTASYSTHLNSGYTFLVIEDISSDGYNVNLSPMVSYAFKDNLTAGVRFGYGRTLLRVDSSKISIGDQDTGIDLEINDIYSISQSFHGLGMVRQYIPLGKSRSFSLFSEFSIGVGGTTSKYAYDSPVQGTYAKSIDASLSVTPGIVAFATNNVAFEVTVGALGFSFSHIKQTQNQIYDGEMNSSNMSFMINIFSIGLGVAFYL